MPFQRNVKFPSNEDVAFPKDKLFFIYLIDTVLFLSRKIRLSLHKIQCEFLKICQWIQISCTRLLWIKLSGKALVFKNTHFLMKNIQFKILKI
jgi:hypothetical protein